MRIRFAVFGVLFPGCLVALHAGGNETPLHRTPSAHMVHFSAAPVIDGKLDDACWKHTPRLSAFRGHRMGAPAKVATEVRLGQDRQWLYVGFICHEPEMKELRRTDIAHDDLALFGTDHVEVFIHPHAAGTRYFQFAVNVDGATYESIGENASWDTELWTAKTARAEDRWTAEVRIPRQAIGVGGRFFRANFCRQRRVGEPETTCWSPTFGGFHTPGRFGAVSFGGRESPLEFVSGRMYETNEAREQRFEMTLKANTFERFLMRGGSVPCEARFYSNGTMLAQQQVAFTPGKATTVAFPFQSRIPFCGSLVVTLTGNDGHCYLWSNPPQSFFLRGTEGLAVNMEDFPAELAPSLQWFKTERLRGYSGAVGHAPVPPLALGPAADAPAKTKPVALRGEAVIRIPAEPGETVAFSLTGGAAHGPFAPSTCALFGPEGSFLLDGIVQPEETKRFAAKAEKAGAYIIRINSGPAGDNEFLFAPEHARWVIDGRGKGAYVSTRVGTNALRDLKLAGFNTAMTVAWITGIDFSTDEGLQRWLATIDPLADAAERYGIRLIPYVGWGCGEQDVTSVGDYRKNVSTRKIDGPRPCPLSRRYWEGSFLRRALALAEYAKTHPAVKGVGLDPESYYFSRWYKKAYEKAGEERPSWSSVVFFSDDECFCDHCLGGFLRAKNLTDPKLPPDGATRKAWLVEHKLDHDYYEYLSDETMKITRSIRERIHEVQPDFLITVMLLTANNGWWVRGATRGLGTPRVPALDFDEGTYTPGYTQKTDGKRVRLAEWGAHVINGGALWLGKHPPYESGYLAAQIYHFAIRGQGYWIWPGHSSLWRNPDTLKSYYSLAGLQEDYWKSFVLANREIDRKLTGGDKAPSDLDLLKPVKPFPNLDRVKGKNEWSRMPFYPVKFAAPGTLAFTVPAGGKTVALKACAHTDKQPVSLRVTPPGAAPQAFPVQPGKDEEFTLRVAEGQTGTAVWTVDVAFEQGGERHVALALDGAAPFWSTNPAALLAPKVK